jgi:stage V sporulation protein AF
MTKTESPINIPISAFISDNANYMKERLGIGITFDIDSRTIYVQNKEVRAYYVNGLCDSTLIVQLLEELIDTSSEGITPHNSTFDLVQSRIIHQQVNALQTFDDVVEQLLSGLFIIFVDGEAKALSIDLRSYPGRNPEEPKSEKIVSGPKDGFVENVIVNTALIRRRIRDDRLRNEVIKVGLRSKTDIVVSYIQDVANPDLVKIIKKELSEINIDGLPMADKMVEEFLLNQGVNPFPQTKLTERPDIAATHLLEGHVLIMVDTSPSAMITPTTYFHHLQHAEEYRTSAIIGTFTRIFRFMAVFASVFLLPLWFVFVIEPQLLPPELSYIGPSEHSNMPVVVQILLAIVALEFLRMAALHTPSTIITAMGLVAAALIGEIAIKVGLFLSEVVLYAAVAMLGTFATPSQELGNAHRIVGMALVVFVYFFHEEGFMVGVTLMILYLASLKPLQTPYLWPFIPFNPAAFMQIFIRPPMASDRKRPSGIYPIQYKRQS